MNDQRGDSFESSPKALGVPGDATYLFSMTNNEKRVLDDDALEETTMS